MVTDNISKQNFANPRSVHPHSFQICKFNWHENLFRFHSLVMKPFPRFLFCEQMIISQCLLVATVQHVLSQKYLSTWTATFQFVLKISFHMGPSYFKKDCLWQCEHWPFCTNRYTWTCKFHTLQIFFLCLDKSFHLEMSKHFRVVLERLSVLNI